MAPVFSVPVIGNDGTIYVGSTDSFLYALRRDGTLKWKFKCASMIAGNSASIGPDGTIYVGDTTTLYAIDPSNGAGKWSFPTHGFVLSSPVVTQNCVYFGSFYVNAIGSGDPTGPYDGHVYAVDSRTGALKWSYLTGGAVGTSGAIGPDGTVYFGSYDGYEYALYGQTGALRWKFHTNGPIQSSAALSGSTLYFGSHDHTFYAVDWRTGMLKFTVPTGQRIVSSPGIGANGLVYFGSWDGYVYAVDGTTGQVRWKFFTSQTSTPGLNDEGPAIGGDGTIYYETNGGGVMYALNGQSGAIKWQIPIDPLNYASISIDPNGTLYVGSLSGKVIAVG
jgi:outer membrane protein assembly factor BamB